MTGVMGGLRALTGIGGASGEEHQFEFVGAGTVLLQSTEMLMAEQATGAVPHEPGVPGSGGSHTGPSQVAGAPRLPARVTEGGAPAMLQGLAHTYLGPDVVFPPMPNPPPGFVTRITPERFGGVGPWNPTQS